MADLPVDPATLDDATITELFQALNAEQSRRAQLKSLPQTAQTVCWQYKSAGGDPADILAAVQAWISSQGDVS